MTKTAWGYVRLSQQGRETSVDDQMGEIRRYARRADGLELATTLNEGTATSGFDAERENYQRLVGKISDGSIDAVVVRDRARLSRDFDERLWLLTEFRRTGVEWHVIEAGGLIEVGDIYTAAMECVHAAMDHVKKMAEIERSKQVTERRIQDGCYQGRPPHGLRFAPDKCHLEKSERWDEVMVVFDRLDEGVVYREIADETGFTKPAISQMKDRGRAWYQGKLAEYGVDAE